MKRTTICTILLFIGGVLLMIAIITPFPSALGISGIAWRTIIAIISFIIMVVAIGNRLNN